jgi:hypothetical protein
MRDASTLKPIGSAHCPQYNTEAKFYIDAAHKSGHRHLIVHYERGGYQGAAEFVAGIPDDWSEENVIDLLLRPMKSQDHIPPGKCRRAPTAVKYCSGGGLAKGQSERRQNLVSVVFNQSCHITISRFDGDPAGYDSSIAARRWDASR